MDVRWSGVATLAVALTALVALQALGMDRAWDAVLVVLAAVGAPPLARRVER